MYPQGELKELVAHKARLERKIFRQREECAEALGRVVQPLVWFETAKAKWGWILPLLKFTALPAGLFARRATRRKIRWLGALLRWGPLLLSAMRGFKAAKAREEAAQAGV